MEITVKWFNDSFNIGLSAKEGAEEFLSVKGCRLVETGGKAFIGFPAKKNEQTGKYWNHVWASDKFQAAVIEKAKAAKPSSRKPPKSDEQDDDCPF